MRIHETLEISNIHFKIPINISINLTINLFMTLILIQV